MPQHHIVSCAEAIIKSRQIVYQEKRRLSHSLINYARSQKYLWQQLPFLALQAHGRITKSKDKGDKKIYLEVYAECFSRGYWPIKVRLDSDRNDWSIFVDCSTGELLIQTDFGTKVLVAYSDLENLDYKDLDAKKIIKNTEDFITRNTLDIWGDNNRKKVITEFNLEPCSYQRIKNTG